ncbi:GNAT family N-acetyltransferase [Halovenus sp. HT40]|uniref:GNAT family N-acetyltransferase n=1 Tax=Halovenus sp. HT40 TaxID=3126691 RepID=UPI00300E9FBA
MSDKETPPVEDDRIEDRADVDVEACDFKEVYELAAEAHEDGVKVQPRDDAEWYRVGDDAIACLWWPQNRSNTARLSHCWVREERRGEGIGASLVYRRVEDARADGADMIDTYAYHPSLYEDLGFEAGESYKMGTTHMTLEVDDND